MTKLRLFALTAAAAAALAGEARATPSAGMSPLGLAAYGKTLQAEAASYRPGARMTAAGLRAYGATLRAEARGYVAAAKRR